MLFSRLGLGARFASMLNHVYMYASSYESLCTYVAILHKAHNNTTDAGMNYVAVVQVNTHTVPYVHFNKLAFTFRVYIRHL